MLRLTTSDFDSIRRHAEKTYPNECCGILLGTVQGDMRTVRSTIRCVNTRTDSPQNRFQIDPRELVHTQREARERGLNIVGFYHSHPDQPARWSVTDLEEAFWIGCSYVITAVENGKATQIHSFALAGSNEGDRALMEEQIVVAPGA